jgi:phosphoribosylformimino-5-aminoimidazole carboxamide ribonucleotide (ProFAR) isomerase
VRTPERVEELLSLGAKHVVVGTRAVEDVRFREWIAHEHPGRVVLAIDVRDREVLVRGWQQGAGRDVRELAAELDPLPLAGLLVTAVHLEGRLGGVDAALYRELAKVTRLPIVASGGVGRHEDLAELAGAGCSAAVIGMALYTGALDARRVAEEHGS